MTDDRAELQRLVFLIVGKGAESARAGQDANGNVYVSFAMGIRRYKITTRVSCSNGAFESIESQLREFRAALDVVESYRLF
jgi:hypothetical protein